MAAGIESPESGGAAGVALEFPSQCASPPGKLPRRIRERLLETKAPLRVEDIEAKLKEADVRRQQFHEWLSNKARPKPRSPSWSSQDEDLGRRLEAKLVAARQKRLNIIMEAQRRLARLNELRKAAKTGMEIKFEKEREQRGTKMESRVQQAELNRMLLLKAHRQRRALARERTARSLSQRIVREKKYKECIHASICQKRASAEKKRLGLLEAEKSRAHARVMQVERIARSVCHRREVERRRMKDQLENRLQRAKRQRAEYLRQRGSPCCSSHISRTKMHKHGDFLSRKLARCWKQFLKSRKTTLALAKAYEALHLNEKSVKLMPFEDLAIAIESGSTIQTVKALLERLDSRLKLLQTNPSNLENIDHLLKRIASPPRKRAGSSNANRSRVSQKGSVKQTKNVEPNKFNRYPPRVVLCSYMILGHPDAVFSGHGEREIALTEAALSFVQEFELLIKIVLEGSLGISNVSPSKDLEQQTQKTFRSQLAAFDAAWCSYLYSFVVWKVKDARSLEDDLVRAACQLEISMIQKCKITRDGDFSDLTGDLKAIQKQVSEDQKLLRQKVQRLSGHAGIERMESALSDTRSKFFEARESGSSFATPFTNMASPSLGASAESIPADKRSVEGSRNSGRVVRSLFKEDSSQLKNCPDNLKGSASYPGPASSEASMTDNILLVNEILHEGPQAFANKFGETNEMQNEIKAKIKETMERAFWDGILECMRQGEQPDYDRILQLVQEVRDELCEMAPRSWKQDIVDTIDLGIFSQVLKSGARDTLYLSQVLEYSLVTLQKLSAPAKASEMERIHRDLLNELSCLVNSDDKSHRSFVTAAIKGLRFVLEQTQILKHEISKARMSMMQHFINGAAGFEYLRKAFADLYGPPSSAVSALPHSLQLFGTVNNNVDNEWSEHLGLLSAVLASGRSLHSSSEGLPPATSLRTGGGDPLTLSRIESVAHPSNADIGEALPECRGERTDLLVRLALLKLAFNVESAREETLAETFKLNFLRLRAVQSQVQKIIVISTSMLVLRQVLVSEKPTHNALDMDSIISESARNVHELLDTSPDAGIVEIVDTMSNPLSPKGRSDCSSRSERIRSRKQMVASLLLKSLQAEDPVFSKVSKTIYLAARGVILSGSSSVPGREVAESALRRVGAAVLTDRLVGAMGPVMKMAMVSMKVHKDWYAVLVGNL